MHQNSEVTPKTSQKSQKRRKKNLPHQTAGVRLRLEFWYNDEKPPKQFSQSYFSKKNHHQVMFSGQNVRFSCFFSVKMTGNQKILDFYLKNSQKISLLEAATASKIDRFSI